MLNFIADLASKVDQNFPVLYLLLPYVGALSVIVILVAIATAMNPANPIKKCLGVVPDKLLLGACMSVLAVWVVFTAIFVFPFHCVKNWDQVRLIRANKRSNKNAR